MTRDTIKAAARLLEYKQMCDRVLAEQQASLAKKASDPAWHERLAEMWAKHLQKQGGAA